VNGPHRRTTSPSPQPEQPDRQPGRLGKQHHLDERHVGNRSPSPSPAADARAAELHLRPPNPIRSGAASTDRWRRDGPAGLSLPKLGPEAGRWATGMCIAEVSLVTHAPPGRTPSRTSHRHPRREASRPCDRPRARRRRSAVRPDQSDSRLPDRLLIHRRRRVRGTAKPSCYGNR